ncbi:phosphatase PAP2 family protein [Candidatus Woesearchaeota archaeon]|nr:phosphatase PAP2 family protein [Candidatus Woesearchaeota archaeon]
MKLKMKKSAMLVVAFYIILVLFLMLSLIFDRQVLSFIASNRISSLNIFFIYFNRINGLVIFTFFLLYFILKKEYKTIKPYLVNVPSVTILAYMLKYVVHRSRPGIMFLPLITKSNLSLVSSFPSGHTIVAFSIIPFLRTGKEKIIWAIMAIFIAFSRLYLGLHYLSDVVAGIFLGLLIANIIRKLHPSARK